MCVCVCLFVFFISVARADWLATKSTSAFGGGKRMNEFLSAWGPLFDRGFLKTNWTCVCARVCLVLARGFRVGVVERGPLLGREQEWNISEAELEEMVEAKVLSKEVK